MRPVPRFWDVPLCSLVAKLLPAVCRLLPPLSTRTRYCRYFDEQGITDVPLFVSGTLVDQSGRTLSGQTTEVWYDMMWYGVAWYIWYGMVWWSNGAALLSYPVDTRFDRMLLNLVGGAT